MRCPHCAMDVSVLSREMNRWQRVKACPHCDRPVRLIVQYGLLLAIGAPIIIVATLSQDFLLGQGVPQLAARALTLLPLVPAVFMSLQLRAA